MIGHIDSSRLLAQSADYALDSLADARVSDLDRPTPCAGWNLEDLLWHLADSLDALTELRVIGRAPLENRTRLETGTGDPIGAVRRRIADLVAAWEGEATAMCMIADRSLWTATAAAVGAIELATHGWDVYIAEHIDRAIPAELAIQLLDVANVLIPEGFRRPEFAKPLPVAASATPSARLLGFLGRASA